MPHIAHQDEGPAAAVFAGSPARSRAVAALVALALALTVAWVAIAAVGIGDAPDPLHLSHAVPVVSAHPRAATTRA